MRKNTDFRTKSRRQPPFWVVNWQKFGEASSPCFQEYFEKLDGFNAEFALVFRICKIPIGIALPGQKAKVAYEFTITSAAPHNYNQWLLF